MADGKLSSARQPICSWSRASRNFAIHIPSEITGVLATESLIAFKRIPRRGLEIGGILLGRIETGEETTTFWIEGFQPIESEHRSGPSYVLSDSDFPRLEAALVANGPATIGIYRSQTRSQQLTVQHPDIDLFGRCFDSREALFLMLAPVPGKAAFFHRTDGEFQCVHEFTVVSSLSSFTPRPARTAVNLFPEPSPDAQVAPLGALDHADFQRRNQQTPAGAVIKIENQLSIDAGNSKTSLENRSLENRVWGTTPAARRSIVLREAFGRFAASQKATWALAAAITLLVLTVSVLSYAERFPIAPGRTPAPQYLQLTVERAGTALRLHWDPHSSTHPDAARAILHIQDGGREIDKNLAPAEFRAGSFAYEPKSSEVTFRLDLYSGEPHAVGLVQVMFPASPVPKAVAAAANLEPKPKLRQEQAVPAVPVPTERLIASSPAPAAAFVNFKAPQMSRIASAKDENRPIHIAGLNVSRESKIAPLETTAAPPVVVTVDKPPLPSRVTTPPEDSVTDQKFSVRISTEAAEGSRLRHLVGKFPGFRHKKTVKGAAPVPIYQAKPVLKTPDAAKLTRPVTIDVKVNIADSGAVDRAEVMEYGEPPNFPLANAALAAARQWTFEAPRVEDGPIANELILHFYFSP